MLDAQLWVYVHLDFLSHGMRIAIMNWMPWILALMLMPRFRVQPNE